MRRLTGMAATFEAAAAIKPHSLVKLDARGKAVPASKGTDYAIGAVQEVGAAKAGDSVTVHLSGIVLLRAAEASSNLAYAVPAADGRCVLKTAIANTDIVAGRWVGGKAGAQNDLVSVLLDRHLK